MQIVKMEEAHVAQIATLEKCCFSDPWSEASIRYELTNRLSYWLVALENETVVGYVGSQSVLGEADMMNLAVAPAYRKQGVGEHLVNRLVADLAEHGVYRLTLEVRVSNTPAISLYEKLGFQSLGRRPNYYRNPREDAWILGKEWDA